MLSCAKQPATVTSCCAQLTAYCFLLTGAGLAVCSKDGPVQQKSCNALMIICLKRRTCVSTQTQKTLLEARLQRLAQLRARGLIPDEPGVAVVARHRRPQRLPVALQAARCRRARGRARAPVLRPAPARLAIGSWRPGSAAAAAAHGRARRHRACLHAQAGSVLSISPAHILHYVQVSKPDQALQSTKSWEAIHAA